MFIQQCLPLHSINWGRKALEEGKMGSQFSKTTYQRILGKHIPASNIYLLKELLWKYFCQVLWNYTTFNPMIGPRKVDCASETSWFLFLRVIICLWEFYCIITSYYTEFLEIRSYFISKACLISPAAENLSQKTIHLSFIYLFSAAFTSLFTTALLLIHMLYLLNIFELWCIRYESGLKLWRK